MSESGEIPQSVSETKEATKLFNLGDRTTNIVNSRDVTAEQPVVEATNNTNNKLFNLKNETPPDFQTAAKIIELQAERNQKLRDGLILPEEMTQSELAAYKLKNLK